MTSTPNATNASFSLNQISQALLTVNRLFEAWYTHIRRKEVSHVAKDNQEKVEQNIVSLRQENTQLGTLKDAQELGLRKDLSGPLLGYVDGYCLFLSQDLHVNTCAFPGSGKTTTLTIPNIISLAMGSKPESVVILDVKNGELAWLTAEGRMQLDSSEAIFINPWGLNGLPNHRLNIFSDIIDKAQRGFKVLDLAQRSVYQRFGDPERYNSNSWIYKDAMRICTVLMVARAQYTPELCNPASFWDFGASTHSEFRNTLLDMISADKDDGYITMMAKKLLDQYGEEKTDQWEWVMDAFLNGFSLYAMGSALRDSCKITEFDASTLKKSPRAIYLMVPDKYLDSHGSWVSDVLEYLVSKIADASGDVRTTFMLDEFVNIPVVRSMVKALRLYRSKGIRIWTFGQDRNGYNKYKDDGGYMPFEESSVSLAWGVTGAHARELSEKAGKRAVLIGTPNNSAGVSADTGGHSASEVLVPNLPISQISQNFSGTAILDSKSKIFVVERKPYWEIPWIRDYVRNPKDFPQPHFED